MSAMPGKYCGDIGWSIDRRRRSSDSAHPLSSQPTTTRIRERDVRGVPAAAVGRNRSSAGGRAAALSSGPSRARPQYVPKGAATPPATRAWNGRRR
jgi:hypothetical protein